MFAKSGVVVMGVVAVVAALGADGASAQVSGRVVLADGPIGVSVAFGDRPARLARAARTARRATPPVRYRRGMSLYLLDLHLERIEREYDHYRRLHHRDAYALYGWSRQELRQHVKWLRDERRWLRRERRRLERSLRDRGRGWRGR